MQASPILVSLLGGALIGLSAALFLLLNGKIAGCSGLFGYAMVGLGTNGGIGRNAANIGFTMGLILVGICAALFFPTRLGTPSPSSLPLVALAGLFVGVGTRIGNGCTSGHGVCGISSGSPRSILATAVFIGAGMGTVLLLRPWVFPLGALLEGGVK